MTMTLPETRRSLFIRLRDGANDDAWREFIGIYEPAVYRFARKRGLQDADARELAQDVLIRVVQVLPQWDARAASGSFRSWLFTVARNRLVDAWRQRTRRDHAMGSSMDLALDEAPDQRRPDDLDAELRREAIRLAAQAIRSEFQEMTWRAFWLTAIEGAPAADVAKSLGLSVGAIYAARSRVLVRLRERARRYWSDWEPTGENAP